MTKQQIREFYRNFKSQILNEIQEYLDTPLDNLEKINNFEYQVWGDNIIADFIFRKKYYDLPNPYFDIEKLKDSYGLEWNWGKNMDDQFKTPKSFLRTWASGYQVIYDFLKSNNPQVLSFSGLSKGHDNIYFGETFLKRLKALLKDEYDIIVDKEESVLYIINKTFSHIKNEVILKRSKTTSINEAIIYWKYSDLHPSTPKNIRVKNKIKQRVIQNLYFKNKEL
jgi:hypothetical protein